MWLLSAVVARAAKVFGFGKYFNGHHGLLKVLEI
jgi:hypothetical protein